MEGYITTYDWEEDCTYACWEFNIPKEWHEDIVYLVSNRWSDVSHAYVQRLHEVYPITICNCSSR